MYPSLATALEAGSHSASLGDLSHIEAHGALLMGLTYGLINVVGPDHLATLMTLASVTSPARAFRVGASWGLGHSFGIIVMAGIFLALHRLVTVNLARWEHYGNYLIGASMMACGLYFILCESSFLKEEADGTCAPLGCFCHGAPQAGAPVGDGGDPEDALAYCHPCGDSGSAPFTRMEELDAAETQPLLAPARGEQLVASAATQEESWWQRFWTGRDAKGALLGIFQGLCCPLGLLGVSFLANLSAAGIAVFLVVFVCVSAFGTAAVAVAWACLTAYGLGAKISPRTVFRASCGLTLTLGAAWITCNAFGLIEKLDYTEGLQHQ